MPATILPAKTYADAYPYLRAPYTPSLIRFRIRTVPDQTSSPCVVVLYVKSETVMDRLNIVCGADWTPPVFTLLVQREEKHGETTMHYVKMRATFTAYGTVYTDTAEATSESEVQAEYDANAHAFKRAARWPGIGQSLYQPAVITMFRGPGKDQLRTRSNNPKKPHIDEKSEQFLLDHYEKLLAEKMIPVYGQPFDHLKALNGNATTPTQIVAPTTALPPPAGSQQIATSEQQPTPVSSDATAQPSTSPAPVRQRPATGEDMAAIRAAAQRAGYTDALSEALMRLARENDESHLTTPFAECVLAWITVLGRGHVKESKILEAVSFALDNCATRQGAQVKFGQWVAAKATAPTTKQPTAPPPPAETATGSESPPQTAGATDPDTADPQVELAAATRELQEAIGRHDYTERAAARIAALAIGADPDRKIDLAKIPPGTLRCVGELLDAAATLEWSTGKLDEEISRAHNSTQQGTSASRFGAFAIHLINSAEAKVEEDARAAAAAA